MSNPTASAAGAALPAPAPKTRRAVFGLFASIPALTVLPALGAMAAPEDRLGSLYADLCRVHAEKGVAGAVDDDEAYEKIYNRHWELREAINGIAATTPAGLRIKAMTAEFALEGDVNAECRGAGSFVDLCQSLHRDLLAANS